jgi:hypothetical protein
MQERMLAVSEVEEVQPMVDETFKNIAVSTALVFTGAPTATTPDSIINPLTIGSETQAYEYMSTDPEPAD